VSGRAVPPAGARPAAPLGEDGPVSPRSERSEPRSGERKVSQ